MASDLKVSLAMFGAQSTGFYDEVLYTYALSPPPPPPLPDWPKSLVIIIFSADTYFVSLNRCAVGIVINKIKYMNI